ncbi:hypothetical protein ACKWTF_010120 [Chironomus riparius]
MNILPHKSWHVRTKKNIARVREDERKAAEQEKEIKRRAALAEQEAKINVLRERAGLKKSNETETSSEQPVNTSFEANEHVNFFKDLEDGKYTSTSENKERTEEKKQEKEKYEKQIGYLTYLGQDTNEALKKRDWYDMLPDRTDKHNEDGSKIEVSLQSKIRQDPLTLIHKYMGTSSSFKSTVIEPEKKQPEVKKYESLLTESLKNYRLKKKKRKYSTSSTSSKDTSPTKKRSKKSKKKKSKRKHRKSSFDSSDSSDEELKRLKQQKLEALRMERLNRERIEREKAENLLRKLRGETEPKQQQPEVKSYKQRYNSQFNPEIARQNQD